ncbi:helix-turn-helix domain-containing protein, partial [Natronorubrum sp. DTA28]|uniref:helix-turn-helix domain-containing protein n=1 Tax=Natronorubrum sp. DTA28 TaxID=3447019 RepID=UPI003F875FFA
PTGTGIMPFLWATGDDFDTFEQKVADHPYVDEFLAIDKVENSTLYRGLWVGDHDDLIKGIVDAEGTILEGHSDTDKWEFHLRLQDHDKLSKFYNFCTDRDISIHIVRTFTVTERTESIKKYGLSHEQREALILGLREGYFDTPSKASLNDLAETLGISQQAMSNRMRRGTEQVLSEALLSTSADFD